VYAASSPKAAAVLAPNRVSLGYAALGRHVDHCGRALRAAGIGPADVVAVALPNGPELASAVLAVASCAVCVPLDPDQPRAALGEMLGRLRPRALITAPDAPAAAREVAAQCGATTFDARWTAQDPAGSFTLAARGGAANAAPVAAPAAGDVALLLPTSGTTAVPRIVPLTRANLAHGARQVADTLALGPADRGLNVMPLFHVHGLVAGVLAPLAAGGSVACAPGPWPDRFGAWCAELAPTWFTAVPAMHAAILAALQASGAPPAFRLVRSASAPLAPALHAAMEAFYGCPVLEAYGMTEASHQVASNPLPPALRRPGSVGQAPGAEVAVVDAGGAPVSAGAEGEIVIRGVGVMRGYWDDPCANREAFRDGWLRTGDSGRMDADGYLYLTGRIKEMINRGGESIAPAEIERALAQHPQVARAVAFAVPHCTLGEEAAAAVVPAAGARLGVSDLRAFALERLGAARAPSRFAVVEAIPTGATGKVCRSALAAALADQLQSPHVEPAGVIEIALAEIWGEVLGGQPPIGAHDSFFALGGDSIKAMQVTARAGSVFGVELAVSELFANPTVAELAMLVARNVDPQCLAQVAAALAAAEEAPAEVAAGR
jgi:acyl-CoA synthetase (AMP-forming)/AMP-acid ligase II/acyl carrier protein